MYVKLTKLSGKTDETTHNCQVNQLSHLTTVRYNNGKSGVGLQASVIFSYSPFYGTQALLLLTVSSRLFTRSINHLVLAIVGASRIFAVLRLLKHRDGQRAPPLVEVNQAILAWSQMGEKSGSGSGMYNRVQRFLQLGYANPLMVAQ